MVIMKIYGEIIRRMLYSVSFYYMYNNIEIFLPDVRM